MRNEALEAAETVARQLDGNRQVLQDLAKTLRTLNPYSLISVARGSSDHAAQYLNYLTMAKLGKLTTSLSMSVLTLYKASLDVRQSVGVAISQSGQSPDVVEPIQYIRSQKAPTIAMVNDTQSPLAASSEWVLPLLAGPERAVAATKSFIASLSASASLVATWKADASLLTALQQLPDDLRRAQQKNWSSAVETLAASKRIMIVGRGYGLALALESALKLKETCGIQAEAFSAAEIKHGPQALIEKGYPLIVYATRGPILSSMLDLANEMRQRGARVLLAAPSSVPEADLEIESSGAEELDIITAAQSFYLLAEELSRHLGMNPDQPPHLAKVTKTK
jgi:glucosamine--fructose-6-phosphate aminotransferase (isomerizing)